MRTILLLALPLFTSPGRTAQPVPHEIGGDIEVARLSDRVYRYTAYADMGSFGRVPCNGIVALSGGEALLVDSPVDDAQTERLVRWVEDSLQARVTLFIPTHWHSDYLGGLGYLQRRGVRSYTLGQTINILRSLGRPAPDEGFADSLALSLNGLDIRCYHPGGGHTPDNFVVWLPDENILFGGCLVKDLAATNLGNLEDAVPDAWPGSIRRVLGRFPADVLIVPGHGACGGTELLQHTLELLDGRP